MRSPRTTRQLGGALALATLSAALVAGPGVSGASAATQAPAANLRGGRQEYLWLLLRYW